MHFRPFPTTPAIIRHYLSSFYNQITILAYDQRYLLRYLICSIHKTYIAARKGRRVGRPLEHSQSFPPSPVPILLGGGHCPHRCLSSQPLFLACTPRFWHQRLAWTHCIQYPPTAQPRHYTDRALPEVTIEISVTRSMMHSVGLPIQAPFIVTKSMYSSYSPRLATYQQEERILRRAFPQPGGGRPRLHSPLRLVTCCISPDVTIPGFHRPSTLLTV